MSVVIVLVFVAIIMAGIFLLAFIWSVKNGQYEDTYTPSVRILFDDPAVKEEKKEKEEARSPTLPRKEKGRCLIPSPKEKRGSLIPNPSPKEKGVGSTGSIHLRY